MTNRLPTLLYHLGSKYLLTPWILSHIPSRLQINNPFYEVYGGGGSVILHKTPSKALEFYNEINPQTYKFFQTLKELPLHLEELIYTPGFESQKLTPEQEQDPIYQAAKFFFWSHTTFRGAGTAWDSQATAYKLGRFYRRQQSKSFRLLEYADRLQSIEVLNKDAIDLIESATPDSVIYADPPYPHEVRNGKDSRHKDQASCLSRNQYKFDMTKKDHIKLLSICLKREGYIFLSSYRNPLYDEFLLSSGWKVTTHKARDLSGRAREEALYLSPELARLL